MTFAKFINLFAVVFLMIICNFSLNAQEEVEDNYDYSEAYTGEEYTGEGVEEESRDLSSDDPQPQYDENAGEYEDNYGDEEM